MLGIGFEAGALAMLLPIIEFIQSGGSNVIIDTSKWHWNLLAESYACLGLEANLGVLLVTSFTLIVFRQILLYSHNLYRQITMRRLERNIRNTAFDYLLYARMSMHDRLLAGDFVNNFMTETPSAVHGAYGFVDLIGYASITLFYVGAMFFLSVEMTLICVVINVAAGYAMRSLMSRSRRVGEELVNANASTSRHLMERLKSIRLVRLGSMETAEISSIRQLTAGQLSRVIGLVRIHALLSAFIDPIVIMIGFTLIYIGVTYLSIEMSLLSVFLIILLRLLPPTKNAIGKYQEVLGRLGSMKSIDDQLRELLDAKEISGGSHKFSGVESSIRFQDVSFNYSEATDQSALSGIDAEIPASKMTALVGPSGAGKSTFIDLLPRLRDANQGQVAFDGVDIREFDLESLRAGIAFVAQTPQLFNVTVSEHIGYGMQNVDPKMVEQAARLGGAHDFIAELPDGYETLIGENGDRLSGGQRQRLDLARALAREAKILILDEPTSALDAVSEEIFRNALREIRRKSDTTVFVIAHRLSTVQDADKIIVLIDGKVSAVGTHNELIQNGGWYADAYHSQSVATA